MTIEIKVPDIGDFTEVEVIEVLIKEGDSISKEQSLITLESDKAAMEIPADEAGVVHNVLLKEGDKVSEGDVIAIIESTESDSSEENIEPPPVRETPPQISKMRDPVEHVVPYAPDVKTGAKNAHASPSVRKFARELGVDINSVNGSGHKGRITKEDVQVFVKGKLTGEISSADDAMGIPAVPKVDFGKFGKVAIEELSRIKKISGKHLHACWLNVPHVTQFADVDITELEEFRKQNKADAANQGVNLTPLVFIMKAVVASLKLYPIVNASLADDSASLVLKDYYNIGVAVDTPSGLVVPVIRDVDKKGFIELAGELGEISQRARDGALTANELQGGTFSISSLGGIGGSFFTPIVNAPQVAILGVGRHKMEPVWNGKEFIPRLMLPLSLSYDHRVVDGADGARFITHLGQMLSDIRMVLL